MKNVGYEFQRPDRNLSGKLWTILKVCFVAVVFAWWLSTSLLLLLLIYALGPMVYHGIPVETVNGTFSAWWYLGGAILVFYWFAVKPFLRSGAFRK